MDLFVEMELMLFFTSKRAFTRSTPNEHRFYSEGNIFVQYKVQNLIATKKLILGDTSLYTVIEIVLVNGTTGNYAAELQK